MNNIFNDKRGFMAIVALGIFALLMLFGLKLQKQTMRTYESVKDGLNYATAGWTADSVMEFLQWELNKHDVGYNLASVDGSPLICAYGNYTDSEGGGAIANLSRV